MDRRILDVCADWPPARTLMGRIAALGIAPTRYFQRLNVLLDDPAAIAYAPILTRQLRTLRRLRVLRGRR